MPRVVFTPNLKRHLDCPSMEVKGATVSSVLASVFAQNPRLKSYLVDEHGRLRQHINVFVDTELIRDRRGLSDPVDNESEIFIIQALSGG